MKHAHNSHNFLKLFIVLLSLPILAFSGSMANYNSSKSTGSLYRSTSHNQNQHFSIPIKPTVVTPPTNINNPGTAAKYFQIKAIEFSGNFGEFRRYSYKGHTVSDFPMGETNGIKFRVRDWTINRDDRGYSGKVSWSNGSFTGGNTKYSPGGFRMYGSGGWLVLQYKNGAYAKFKINKRAVSGKYIEFYNSGQGVTFSTDANLRRFCFSSSLGKGCVSYNIAYEAIP